MTSAIISVIWLLRTVDIWEHPQVFIRLGKVILNTAGQNLVGSTRMRMGSPYAMFLLVTVAVISLTELEFASGSDVEVPGRSSLELQLQLYKQRVKLTTDLIKTKCPGR